MTDSLAAAHGRLEANDAQRRKLIAGITHELATPLTAIRGSVETLLDARVVLSEEERTLYMRGMLEEARRLDRLTRDLFELARLEAGASPFELERLDLASLCRNTVARFEPRFRAAGLALAWRGPLPDAWIVADGHRLEQVLENLLVNALRYVPAGGTVNVSLSRVAGDPGSVRLTVSDDGPGIADDELPHVFERFYRGDRAGSSGRDPGGSGLGLAIVREIVERHGGAARAELRRPRGLSIVIDLPAAA
jgi:signal transduction histidine kinase